MAEVSSEIALMSMSMDLTDDKSTLVQVVAWCHQATSHYLSQCWPRSMTPCGITRPQWVNHTPTLMKLKGGYTGFTLSVCPSVHLSICGQNRVRSVSSTILIKFWRILLICSFDFVFFWLWLGIQYDSIIWVIMRRRWVSSEHRRSSCSSFICLYSSFISGAIFVGHISLQLCFLCTLHWIYWSPS